MPKLLKTQKLYVRSMGKVFPVTALFDNDDDANKYCANHKDEGVMAVVGKIVIICPFYPPKIELKE